MIGAGSDDDKSLDAGRIIVHHSQSTGGTTMNLTADVNDIIIDGVNAGDLAGSTVGSIADLNGDGRAEILVGAPGMDNGAAVDAGAAFVLWGQGPVAKSILLTLLAGYTLADNFENLTQTALIDFSGIGNQPANSITGNGGNDVLSGPGGNDKLN